MREVFRISRGAKDQAIVIYVELHENGCIGRGEAVPYARYGETPEAVLEQILSVKADIEADSYIQSLLPAGSARNAVDCALWDLQTRLSGKNISTLTDMPWPKEILTAQTIGIDDAAKMAQNAQRYRDYPLLKIKLDAHHIVERVNRVHQAAPQAQLIIDANESWSLDILKTVTAELMHRNVVLIEQPLPQNLDEQLAGLHSPIPLCADESCHVADDVARLASVYAAINIKLDKAGGLTEAIRIYEAARQQGLKVMVGCMVCTSLGIAPIWGLAGLADFADLDGPYWLLKDRGTGLIFKDGKATPPQSDPLGGYWGGV